MFGKMKVSLVLFILLFTMIIAGCGDTSEDVELIVSAAASLTDALKDIQRIYESDHPTIKLNYNFGASGTLQQQIEQGAPADVFIAAASVNMKALTDKGLIESDKQMNLLKNELVLVIPADREMAIEEAADLTDEKIKYVAIGIPESVPAGSYTKEALASLKLWEKLQPKMVQGKDVRQVLQYVETENADAGFVYKSDALTSGKVKIAFAVDPNTYSVIEYPVGVVKTSRHSREAEDFYQFLQTPEALNVFADYGFSIPER